MTTNRPAYLSIAGYDPSGGAGVLADMKTAEMLGIHGLAAITGLTYQNDVTFNGVQWLDIDCVIKQCEPLFERYQIGVAKIGLVRGLPDIEQLIDYLLTRNPEVKIIWDPILQASAGFEFHPDLKLSAIEPILGRLALFTPNIPEIIRLSDQDPIEAASQLSRLCPVLLKGGHSKEADSVDRLIINADIIEIPSSRIPGPGKHGSGCVLASACAAYLAKGLPLVEAIRMGQAYVRQFLLSSDTRVGFHKSKETHAA